MVICSWQPFIQPSTCLLVMIARGGERAHGVQIAPEVSLAQNERPRTRSYFPFWLWQLSTSLFPFFYDRSPDF